MLLGLATLALAVAMAVTLLRSGSAGPVALALAAAGWLLVNAPVAGPVVVGLRDYHGIHVADLALALVVALVLTLRRGRLRAARTAAERASAPS